MKTIQRTTRSVQCTSELRNAPVCSSLRHPQVAAPRRAQLNKSSSSVAGARPFAAAPQQQARSSIRTNAASTLSKATVVEQSNTPLDIVFVSAEVSPWSKTGGLGDVVGGLPIELAKRGHRVITISPRRVGQHDFAVLRMISVHSIDRSAAVLLPDLSFYSDLVRATPDVYYARCRYDQYSDGWDTNTSINIDGEDVRYFHAVKKGVHRVFIDHPTFLAKVWGKTGAKLYGPRSGADYVDNQARFSLFCKAAIEATRTLPFGPVSGDPLV
jgi:granule-bound starch synthase